MSIEQMFDTEGMPNVSIRHDATIKLDAIDLLRLHEVCEVAGMSNETYSDTATWAYDMKLKVERMIDEA